MCRVCRVFLSGIFGNFAVPVHGDWNLGRFLDDETYVNDISTALSFNMEKDKCYIGPAVVDHHTVIKDPRGMTTR